MTAVAEVFRAHWRDHAGLLLSAVTFGLIVFRILAVSHFDFVTAAAIVQRGGTTNVLTGAVLVTLPTLVGAMAPLLTALVATNQNVTFREAPRTLIATVVLFVLWNLVVPLAVAVVITGAMQAILLVWLLDSARRTRSAEREPSEDDEGVRSSPSGGRAGRLRTTLRDMALSDEISDEVAHFNRAAAALEEYEKVARPSELAERAAELDELRARLVRDRDRLLAEHAEVVARFDRRAARIQAAQERASQARARATRYLVRALVLVAIGIFVWSSFAPWLPAERIETRSEDPFTGYVLDQSDEGLVVLRDRDRVVLVIPPGEEPARILCDPTTGEWVSTPLELIAGPRYLACPDN